MPESEKSQADDNPRGAQSATTPKGCHSQRDTQGMHNAPAFKEIQDVILAGVSAEEADRFGYSGSSTYTLSSSLCRNSITGIINSITIMALRDATSYLTSQDAWEPSATPQSTHSMNKHGLWVRGNRSLHFIIVDNLMCTLNHVQDGIKMRIPRKHFIQFEGTRAASLTFFKPKWMKHTLDLLLFAESGSLRAHTHMSAARLWSSRPPGRYGGVDVQTTSCQRFLLCGENVNNMLGINNVVDIISIH
eukprot:4045440-Amphidinium_carterae.1